MICYLLELEYETVVWQVSIIKPSDLKVSLCVFNSSY